MVDHNLIRRRVQGTSCFVTRLVVLTLVSARIDRSAARDRIETGYQTHGLKRVRKTSRKDFECG